MVVSALAACTLASAPLSSVNSILIRSTMLRRRTMDRCIADILTLLV
jgi:hypothetical protein